MKKTKNNKHIKEIDKMINAGKEIRNDYKKDRYVVDLINSILDDLRDMRRYIERQDVDCESDEPIEFVLELKRQNLRPFLKK